MSLPAPTTPIVASNAALAPVVEPSLLNAAASHLSHVPITADDVTEFGGFHAHAPRNTGAHAIQQQHIIPGAQHTSAQPIHLQQQTNAQPILQMQQPIQQQPIQPQLVQMSMPIIGQLQPIQQQQQPILQQHIQQQPILHQQSIQAQQPIHLPAGPVTPAGQLGSPEIATPQVNIWSEEETAKLVALQEQQAAQRMLAAQSAQQNKQVLAAAPVVAHHTETLAPVHTAPVDVAHNATLAQRIPGELLRAEKGELHHVSSSQLVAGPHTGSLHPAGTLVQPSAAQLAAEKAELHHVSTGAPNLLGSIHPSGAVVQTDNTHPNAAQLLAEKQHLHHVALNKATPTVSGGVHLIATPDQHIVPSQAGSSVANNATLAQVIQPGVLTSAHKALGHVSSSEVLPSSHGGHHPAGAQLGHAAIDSAALQRVEQSLHHVAIEKAPSTLSGGKHLLGQPDQHIVPEAAHDAATLAANNAALVGVVQPAQLAAQHKQLHSLPVDTQPSQFGGVHAPGAQTGVIADRVALQYVKEHGLNHVALDKAATTASGGKHLIAQPDRTVIPEQAAANVPHNVALAGVVSSMELRHEKRALEHVPIERQHATASGGLHMADTSATEPLSILDRFKSVIGLETEAERRAHAPAPGLGRVVEKVPVAIQAHTIDTPAQAEGVAKLAMAPQNATLAQKITPQELNAEHAQLLPVAGSSALAPVVSERALQTEHAQLHHVGATPAAAASMPAAAPVASPDASLLLVEESVVSVPVVTVTEVSLTQAPLAAAKTDAQLPHLSAGQTLAAQSGAREVAPAAIAHNASKLPAEDALAKELWASDNAARSAKEDVPVIARVEEVTIIGAPIR